jgi:prevent-host-death family protein
MQSVNVADFKSRFSHFLGLVEGGEEVQVCKRNVPVARIVPDGHKAPANRTVLGCGSGTVQVHCDLTDPVLDASEWDMLRGKP